MRYCPKCQSSQESLRGDECENCGSPLVEDGAPPPPRHDQARASSGSASSVRYPAVRTLSATCRALAFLALAVGVVIAGLGIILKTGGLAFSLLALLCGVGVFILLLAVAEGFRIIVDIEANTRASMEYLRGQPGPQL